MSEEEKKEEEIQEPELLEGVDEVKTLKEEFEKISKERDEYLDGWRRSKADLINYKKEEFKRLEEMAKFSNEDLIKELVSVLDSIDLGMLALEKIGPVEKGFYMIRSKLEDIMKRRGLVKIKVEVKDKFNPLNQEAIAAIDGEGESGSVAEEVEAGYMMYDKVLRPARVKLFK